jgi:hypothetical protein
MCIRVLKSKVPDGSSLAAISIMGTGRCSETLEAGNEIKLFNCGHLKAERKDVGRILVSEVKIVSGIPHVPNKLAGAAAKPRSQSCPA